jgi:hypothetical protein
MFHYLTGFTNFAITNYNGHYRLQVTNTKTWKVAEKDWYINVGSGTLSKCEHFHFIPENHIYTIRSKKHNMVKNAQQRPLGT